MISTNKQTVIYLDGIGDIPCGLPLVDLYSRAKLTTTFVKLTEAATNTSSSCFVPI